MLIKLDALFEIVLGAGLVVAAANGSLDGGDFASPVGTAVLLVVGAALILLGVVIWGGRLGVKQLALGNAVSAIAGLVWLLAASGFSAAGTAIVTVAVASLAVLAAAQAISLRA